MIASGSQNQLQSSFALLGDLLEQFQFFPLIVGSRVYSNEKFFQGVEGKWLQVIMSLFLSPILVFVCITCVLPYFFLSRSSFMHCFVFV